jgi:ribonucleotide monophosphatase NagD (HAD superfamily)
MLEHASGKHAVVTGKPSAEFFHSALDLIGLQAKEVAMIGDDLESDVGGAQSAGSKGILVLSGKTSERPKANATIQADSVLGSVAEMLEIL